MDLSESVITALCSEHSKTHEEIMMCLRVTSSVTKSELTDVIDIMKSTQHPDKRFYIHYYNEDKDKEYDDIELSRDVTECLMRKGYQLIRKIGKGSSADVFLGRSDKYGYVAILIKGNQTERSEDIYNIYQDQQSGVLDTKYTVKIYDIIECPRLTHDKRYPKTAEVNPIQILEYAPATLEDYIRLSKTMGVERHLLEEKILFDLTEAYNHISSLGYTYTDLKSENLVILGGRIKFIDLETLRKGFSENPNVARSLKYLMSEE